VRGGRGSVHRWISRIGPLQSQATALAASALAVATVTAGVAVVDDWVQVFSLIALYILDRVIAPAPPVANGGRANPGFTPKDLSWILTEAPFETLVLKPGPADEADVAA
jgi:hypothetical protein